MAMLPRQLKGVTAKTQRKGLVKRKYNTGSTIWRRIRMAQLHKEPLCQDCSTSANPVPAIAVDHVDGNSHNNRSDNLRSLCTSCHSVKTNKYDGGLGR